MEVDQPLVDPFGVNEGVNVVTADNMVTKVVVMTNDKVKYAATDEDISKLYSMFGLLNVDLSELFG